MKRPWLNEGTTTVNPTGAVFMFTVYAEIRCNWRSQVISMYVNRRADRGDQRMLSHRQYHHVRARTLKPILGCSPLIQAAPFMTVCAYLKAQLNGTAP